MASLYHRRPQHRPQRRHRLLVIRALKRMFEALRQLSDQSDLDALQQQGSLHFLLSNQ
jgi:hypothetical protein